MTKNCIMFFLGIANFIFLSHLSYIIAEKKVRVYRSRQFWLLIDGLLISLYLTIWYMSTPISGYPSYFYW